MQKSISVDMEQFSSSTRTRLLRKKHHFALSFTNLFTSFCLHRRECQDNPWTDNHQLPNWKSRYKKICRLSCQLYHHYQQSQKHGKHTTVSAQCFPYQRQISRCHHRRRRMDSSRSNHYGRSTHRKRKHYRNKQSCYQRCTPMPLYPAVRQV